MYAEGFNSSISSVPLLPEMTIVCFPFSMASPRRRSALEPSAKSYNMNYGISLRTKALN